MTRSNTESRARENSGPVYQELSLPSKSSNGDEVEEVQLETGEPGNIEAGTNYEKVDLSSRI